MLKKRVIPILLYRDGRLVKGSNFQNYRETGMPQSAVRVYSSQNADELFIINISDSSGTKDNFEFLIELAAQECQVPVCAGGGVNNIEEIRRLIRKGADKVLINSHNYVNYDLIKTAVRLFGSQAITAGVDFRKIDEQYVLFSDKGKKLEKITVKEHVKNLQDSMVGEIFINSIDKDGLMSGYDLNVLDEVKNEIHVPLIIGGGAGNFEHLERALRNKSVSGVACGSLFNFGDNNPIRARSYLKNHEIPVRKLK
jgi:cyclase